MGSGPICGRTLRCALFSELGAAGVERLAVAFRNYDLNTAAERFQPAPDRAADGRASGRDAQKAAISRMVTGSDAVERGFANADDEPAEVGLR